MRRKAFWMYPVGIVLLVFALNVALDANDWRAFFLTISGYLCGFLITSAWFEERKR